MHTQPQGHQRPPMCLSSTLAVPTQAPQLPRLQACAPQDHPSIRQPGPQAARRHPHPFGRDRQVGAHCRALARAATHAAAGASSKHARGCSIVASLQEEWALLAQHGSASRRAIHQRCQLSSTTREHELALPTASSLRACAQVPALSRGRRDGPLGRRQVHLPGGADGAGRALRRGHGCACCWPHVCDLPCSHFKCSTRRRLLCGDCVAAVSWDTCRVSPATVCSAA